MRGGAEIIIKKLLSILFCLTILPSFAVTITADTQLKWNAIVIVAAANDAGLQSYTGTHPDVSLTYTRIMNDLLARQTFSVTDAVSACITYCEKSDFLKNGRGQSGKKCPEICESFGNALITENNNKTDSIQIDYNAYNALGKIYSEDKNFYALKTGKTNLGAYSACYYSIFESATNKKIASCNDSLSDCGDCPDRQERFKILDTKYNEYVFGLTCDYGSSEPNGNNSCWLYYTTDSVETKVYSSDKKFYITIDDTIKGKKINIEGWSFTSTGEAVFESSTNKMVAITYAGRAGDNTWFDIIDEKYKFFEFDGSAVGLTGSGYTWLEYKDYEQILNKELKPLFERCSEFYAALDLSSAKQIQDDVLFDLVLNHGTVLEISNFIRFEKDFQNIKHKYNGMNNWTLESILQFQNDLGYVCRNLNADKANKSIYEAKSGIECVKNTFKTSNKYAGIQTEDLKDAIIHIEDDLSKNCSHVQIGSSQGRPNILQCSGDCNKTGQDYVTCTLGDLKATFEFDDICNKKIINLF